MVRNIIHVPRYVVAVVVFGYGLVPSVRTLSVFHFVSFCSRSFPFYSFASIFFSLFRHNVFLSSESNWTLAVLAGVLAGCGGLFLPGGRGLSPLSAGVPWAVQSAVLGSAFYCCCCYSDVLAGTCAVHPKPQHGFGRTKTGVWFTLPS